MDRKLWEIYPNIWKSESAYLSWVRGGIRRYLWSKNPVKLEFVKKARKQIKNPVAKNAKRFPNVWGGCCAICNKDFALKDMEVDHRQGEHSLRSTKDIQSFVEGIVFVTEDDLQLVCKPCHKIKTLAERQGMSHEDAAIEKQAIIICKLKANDVKSWITQRGEVPARLVKERREQVTRLLKEGK